MRGGKDSVGMDALWELKPNLWHRNKSSKATRDGKQRSGDVEPQIMQIFMKQQESVNKR